MLFIKKVLKQFLPPIILDIYHRIRKTKQKEEFWKEERKKNEIHWRGNYASWEEAVKASDGYDAPLILEKVRQAVLKVKNGEAAYERDSVVFNDMEYHWPLLAILMKIAAENQNELHIIDFGGSLGSSYFQNRSFLQSLNKFTWSVVEQKHFVECGNREIADGILQFYYTIDEALQTRKPNTLLLSGVLQCLDKPYEWMEKLMSYGFEYIIIDRTAFIKQENDRLTVQHVPEAIYKASYPAWFFNEKRFLSHFLKKYEIIAKFDGRITAPYVLEDGQIGYWSGFMLKKYE